MTTRTAHTMNGKHPPIPASLSPEDKAAFIAGAAIRYSMAQSADDIERSRERWRVFGALFPHIESAGRANVLNALGWGNASPGQTAEEPPHSDPQTAATVYLGRGVLVFLGTPPEATEEAEEARRLVQGWIVAGAAATGLVMDLQGDTGREIRAALTTDEPSPSLGPVRPGGRFGYRGGV
jgi:hypothetical protein